MVGSSGWLRRLRDSWRASLVLRTVLATLGLSLLVVGVVATALLNRTATGLLEAKQERSLAEATAGWEQARRILAAADAGPSAASPARIVDGVVADLARNAGSPARYEVLLLLPPGSEGTGPERATNTISPASIPQPLAAAIAERGQQLWTSTSARYLDGSRSAAMVVGAPVEVPGAGPYQLFHVFPYAEEQQIIDLVRSATLIAGLLLLVLLGALVWFVTRQVAVPIRRASDIAGRFAAGDLEQRIAVRGSDEIARLGTAFNEMAASLREQITRLEELSRMQQQFTADVSHELRTPLTTVRMASDLLLERKALVDADTARAIELLAGQVDRFESLLSDLLEISRIDAGAVELDLEQVDLAEIAQGLVATTGPLALERGCAVRLRVIGSPTAAADRRRVARILRNLLTNALEYGAGQPVDVLVAGDPSAVAVGVRDRGPGLDPAARARVFDRFWRADPARARTIGGTGLGLSIAKEDAELHHGALEVDSEPGAGSLFVLTLARRSGRRPSSRPVPVALAEFDLLHDKHLRGAAR